MWGNINSMEFLWFNSSSLLVCGRFLWILIFLNYSSVISYRNRERIASNESSVLSLPIIKAFDFIKNKNFFQPLLSKCKDFMGQCFWHNEGERFFPAATYSRNGRGGGNVDLINRGNSLPHISGSTNFFIQHPLVFTVCLKCTRSCYLLTV